MNKKILKHLKTLYKHVEYYNKMSPFPIYDTDWVKDVKDKIKEMEDTKEDYDQLPVVACRNCKSLYIKYDDDMNEHCMRCGSTNELKEFDNINEYEKFKNGKNS